jgi:hypothetical protein
MCNNQDLTVQPRHITDSEIAAIIRYLDPTPVNREAGEKEDTVIVIVFCILMFLIATLPFISLYLKTS